MKPIIKQQILDNSDLELSQEERIILFNDFGFNGALHTTPVSTPNGSIDRKRKNVNIENDTSIPNIKILSNFYFARDNTKTPFYISMFIVILNILISVSFFSKIGFIIIPIATSISTWIGVFIYLYLLNLKKALLLKNYLILNFIKILVSTILMSLVLLLALDSYANYLEYFYKYKAIYLISIVSFVGILYLLSCYLLGILKLKNYKTN